MVFSEDFVVIHVVRCVLDDGRPCSVFVKAKKRTYSNILVDAEAKTFESKHESWSVYVIVSVDEGNEIASEKIFATAGDGVEKAREHAEKLKMALLNAFEKEGRVTFAIDGKRYVLKEVRSVA